MSKTVFSIALMPLFWYNVMVIASKQNLSKTKIVLIALFGALTALMIVFGFLDLQISLAAYNRNSVFGEIFRVVGELPSLMLVPTFVAIVAFKFENRIIRIAALVLLLPSNYFWAEKLVDAFGLSIAWSWTLIVVFAVAFSTGLLLALSQLPKEKIDRLFFVIFVGAIFVALSNGLVHILKMIWGRVRFRHLEEVGFSKYTPWFLPQGFTGNKSFPSGHTASACGMLTIFLFCFKFNLKALHRVLLCSTATAFIVCTAISRIVVGAHFASDVTFSILLSLALFLLSLFVVESINRRINSKPKEKQN